MTVHSWVLNDIAPRARLAVSWQRGGSGADRVGCGLLIDTPAIPLRFAGDELLALDAPAAPVAAQEATPKPVRLDAVLLRLHAQDAVPLLAPCGAYRGR